MELVALYCTGSDYLDTVLQLRPPFAWHQPDGLRLPRRPPRAPAHHQALHASTASCDGVPGLPASSPTQIPVCVWSRPFLPNSTTSETHKVYLNLNL
jgi:hypothetical protein